MANQQKLIKTQHEYSASIMYEKIICRSLQSEDIKSVVRRSAYLKLLTIRDGFKIGNESVEKQFNILKRYLIDALSKFLTRKLSTLEKVCISRLVQKTSGAVNLNQIDVIIQEAIEITDRFKYY